MRGAKPDKAVGASARGAAGFQTETLPPDRVPQFLEVVERLISLGWQPVPEIDKIPVVKGWQQPRRPEEWRRALRGRRRPIYTGLQTDNIIALDLDVEDEVLARGLMCLSFARLGAAPVRFGRAPRRLLPYRVREEMRSSVMRFELDGAKHAIEVLGRGRKFTAIGPHLGTGRPYCWDASPLDIPRASLMLVTPEAVLAYRHAAARMVTRAGGAVVPISGNGASRPAKRHCYPAPSLMEVARTLAQIPNHGQGQDWATWFRVGAALKTTLGDRGETLWMRWSSLSDKDRPGTTAATWESINVPSITYGTLRYLARTLGPRA